MKYTRILFISFFIILLMSCNNADNTTLESKSFLEEKERGAVLSIETKIIDFGQVSVAKKEFVKLNVDISNKGTTPLILYKADVSCGCMNVKFTKKTLRPNENSIINIDIRTEGNDGFFNKAVFIRSNAKNDPEIIRVKGEFVN